MIPVFLSLNNRAIITISQRSENLETNSNKTKESTNVRKLVNKDHFLAFLVPLHQKYIVNSELIQLQHEIKRLQNNKSLTELAELEPGLQELVLLFLLVPAKSSRRG